MSCRHRETAGGVEDEEEERGSGVFLRVQCVGVHSLTLKCFPAGDSRFSQTSALHRVTGEAK